MFLWIKFTAGNRAPAWYTYRNKFAPAFWNRSAKPLYLTDFKNIEVTYPALGYAGIKCYFTDGTNALAYVDPQTLGVLQKFIYNSQNTPDGQQPEIPINTIGRDILWVGVVMLILLYACAKFLRQNTSNLKLLLDVLKKLFWSLK